MRAGGQPGRDTAGDTEETPRAVGDVPPCVGGQTLWSGSNLGSSARWEDAMGPMGELEEVNGLLGPSSGGRD